MKKTSTFLERDAVISDCKMYRYLLRRTWDRIKPRALFIMLNPSTADAEVDDATIRACMRLSRDLGYGSFEVVNLMAWRTTEPDDLPSNLDDAIGPSNISTIRSAIARSTTIICAWGAHKYTRPIAVKVLEMIGTQRSMYCFGTTKKGDPRHPLYIKSGTPLELYRRDCL